MIDPGLKRRGLSLLILITVQAFAAVFFVTDSVADYWDSGALYVDLHLIVETLAALTLAISIVIEVVYLLRMLRRQARMERGLSVASGALHELMESYFQAWRLTPSEQDVATFAIKGASISEIAQMRGSAEGTVKAHLNAIYRKAGVNGRGDLVSLLIEDLMTQPLVPPGDGQAAAD